MARTFSIRTPLQGELADFMKLSGFECVHTAELVRDLTCLLASYREENIPLFPSVFVLPSRETIFSLSPGTTRLVVGEANLGSAAEKVLKECANLAIRGWAIYVSKIGENMAEYGVFRAIIHSFATSAEEAMIEGNALSPVILIRNCGRLVVELLNAKNDKFTVSFTSAPASESLFFKHVDSFVFAVSNGLTEENRKVFKPYLFRFLTDVLQRSHGTLLASYLQPANGTPPETLKDGVWLTTPIDIASIHRTAVEANDAQSLATLTATEALITGMIASDGIVVFGTSGTLLGYHIFLKPTDEEKKNLPDGGGGRRRTYILMRSRLDNNLKAAFFRSQDGQSECEKVD